MRILLDEMLPGTIAMQMRKRGLDADAVVLRSELVGASDADVLASAAIEGRTLVTLNIGDFVILDRRWRVEGRTHSGIVLVSSRSFPSDAAFVGSVTTALAKLVRRTQAANATIWFL